jgi:hypothetical protein
VVGTVSAAATEGFSGGLAGFVVDAVSRTALLPPHAIARALSSTPPVIL